MNFFEHQERSRKRSGYLLILFGLAVFLIIATCYLAVQGFLIYQAQRKGLPISWWDHRIFLLVGFPVIGIIAVAAMSKMALLRQGGAWVAQSLGGKQVLPGTKDPEERRFLNVVEEMALAAGVPVPPAFVLENESGINAFAAGNSPSDAAVAVTRGALSILNRDELQGVVAHEFSHIVNGDMRINIRLMGLLAGILALAVVGWSIIRFAPRGRGKGNGGIAVAGLALVVLGYGGVFVGRLIQSAVSRQREFLADASAVQFTRNPNGIAGALKKIGGYEGGSLVSSASAKEASHMFFGETVSGFFANVFATHPPLAERIRRVDPQFSGEMEQTQREAASLRQPSPARAAASGFAQGNQSARRVRAQAAETLERTGQMTPQNIEQGQAVSESVPKSVRPLLEHPLSASALVTALMLDTDPEARASQMALLSKAAGESFARETANVQPLLESIPRSLRLPLADMAMPALRQMSARQANSLRQVLVQLAMADNRLTLPEFCLLKVVEMRLLQAFEGKKQPIYNDVRRLGPEVSSLLSALAWVGNADKARAAFHAGGQLVAWAQEPSLGPQEFDASLLSSALNKLGAATPQVQKAVFKACATVVLMDGEVSEDEAELLRSVAYCLAMPLPPFLSSVSA